MSGTSMASPAVAGLIALVLAEAQARGLDLSAEQIRTIVIDSARRNPPSGTAWHPRYGHGRVSATAAVQAVINMAGGGGTPLGTGAAAAAARAPSKRKAVAKATKPKKKG